MFGHLFKYGFLAQMRERTVVFWTLLFPFALCTFMYLAFGNIHETTEKMKVVPVAFVEQKENEVLSEMLDMLSEEGEDPLLQVKKTSDSEAKALLSEEEVAGIIYVGDSVELVVGGNGTQETMLQMILDQFLQYEKTITDVGQHSPEKLMSAVDVLTADINYFSDETMLKGNQDNVTNYYYAVFAMACLFCSYAGCNKAMNLQGNVSALGQRRNVVPTHKMKVIVADFASSFLVQYVILCLLLVYMKVGLKLKIGDNIPAILLILFVGAAYGIFFGMFVGSIPRFGENVKVGILTSVSLILCVMSDLMAQGIKNLIDQHVPIVNDLNPAALIADSFYALNVFDTYDRFAQNMCLLGGGAILWGVVCYILMRRSRYASL